MINPPPDNSADACNCCIKLKRAAVRPRVQATIVNVQALLEIIASGWNF